MEIAQHVMAFLHKHDRPPVSLHQEMVMRQKEEEMKKQKQLEDEEIQFRLREVEEVSGCGLFLKMGPDGFCILSIVRLKRRSSARKPSYGSKRAWG